MNPVQQYTIFAVDHSQSGVPRPISECGPHALSISQNRYIRLR